MQVIIREFLIRESLILKFLILESLEEQCPGIPTLIWNSAFSTWPRACGRAAVNGHPITHRSSPALTYSIGARRGRNGAGRLPYVVKVCGALGAPELANDPAYKDNEGRLSRRAELVGHLAELTKKFRRAELLEKLEAVGVPAGPINDLEQVISDPQVVHRGMRISRPSAAAKDGAIPGVRTPIMIDGAPMAAEHPSPRLGEHTEQILREIGEA